MLKSIADNFDNGKVYLAKEELNASNLVWNAHPSFKGVYLKHLIKGSETGGKISCHLVKIEPNCTIGTHIHEGIMELHEVIEGTGTCIVNGKKIEYSKGVIAIMPADEKHEVSAGESGLFLLAKFAPPLL